MDNTTIPKEIKERFLELPEMVQKIILESNWEETTRNIVSKYNLRIDQGSFIETETMLVMFGFIAPENFKKDLIKEAGIDEETAKKIEGDVSEKIFKLIKGKIIVETEGGDIETKENSADIKNTDDELGINKKLVQQEGVGEDKTKEEDMEQNKEGFIADNLENETIEKPKKIDPYLEPIE